MRERLLIEYLIYLKCKENFILLYKDMIEFLFLPLI